MTRCGAAIEIVVPGTPVAKARHRSAWTPSGPRTYTPRRGPAPKYCRDKACRSAAYYARHRRVCLERTYRWRAANADRVRRYERERRKTARGA